MLKYWQYIIDWSGVLAWCWNEGLVKKTENRKMAKKVEDIVRGAGLFQALITLLVAKVQEFGGYMDDIYRLVTPEGSETLSKIAQVIVEAGKKVRDIFSVFVDCTLPLEEMIVLGKYDWVNSDVNKKNFPIDEKVKANVPMRVFHFDKNMSSAAVAEAMDKEGWKPAKIWHLLFFGAKYPELQKKFPIVALGSVWHGCVAYLGWDSFICERSLYLSRIDHAWNDYWRFLAVRK